VSNAAGVTIEAAVVRTAMPFCSINFVHLFGWSSGLHSTNDICFDLVHYPD
jgi:hypothetical protein